MHDDIRARLRTLLAQPNRDELLDDPRRLAELVRERLGSSYRREASILNAVMQEGVPKRLMSMSTTHVTDAMARSYARKISEDTALKEDAVKSAVETWAVALGFHIDATPPPPPPPPAKTPDRTERPRVEVAAPGMQAGARPPPAPGAAAGGSLLVVVGVALLVQAAAKLALNLPYIGRVLASFSGSSFQLIYVLAFAVALASIPIGIGAIQRGPWVRPIALIVCGLGVPIYCLFFVYILGSSFAFANALQTLNTFANVLGLVVHAGGFVCFLLWRPAQK
jgi:hypothetical protein